MKLPQDEHILDMEWIPMAAVVPIDGSRSFHASNYYGLPSFRCLLVQNGPQNCIVDTYRGKPPASPKANARKELCNDVRLEASLGRPQVHIPPSMDRCTAETVYRFDDRERNQPDPASPLVAKEIRMK